MKKFIKEQLNNKKRLSYMIIIAIAIFLCIPLFSKYMDIARDDGIQHICRLIGTFNSIKQGDKFGIIMSDFCNGFGYSWNLFYSPLTAYIPLLFRLFTSSFVLCLKLFMLFTIALSGICMFQFVYKMFRSYKAGVIVAVLYMCAPYHLTDLYNRIAIAELASFIFLPIVFSGMYDLFHRKNKKPYSIIIGAVGLILTHNIIAVYTAIFCFVYLLIHYKKITTGTIKKIVISVILILLCTSFYWIPLLEHMLATNYEVFLPQRMYKDNTLISSKLGISDLFVTKHFEMNFHIGFVILFGILLLVCYRKKIPNRYKEPLRIFSIFGIVSVIMTLKIFPFEYLPNSLKMIQFTWRMMEFASFFLSIVAGVGFACFMNSNPKKEIYIVIFLIVYMCISLICIKQSVEIPFNEENYLTPVAVTSSTGRVHAGCASFEYLPQKAFQNRRYVEQRTDEVIVLDGNATISEMNKKNTNLTFKVESIQKDTKLELPYIFYLGYSAKLEKEDGTIQHLEIEESENGFCMVTVSNINGIIYVSYTGTIWIKLSYVLTIIGLCGILWSNLKKIT